MTTREVPVVTLRPQEAARALGVSESWFNRNVAPDIPRIKRGQLVLYTVASLTKWAEANMERHGG